ncbi:VOC family protein [Paenibacillus flagellatus]|uniref:VOC domain-containing protein n=1 Tax=Paenibacillus flagellatus TaxID=2211139 RepID=A0A2V5K083_9BACL|nr:VOC family protein [Paenibacillus flagellatus]PYI52605.1 hypothetical protein DLM86_20765 [Paenibacillus flagellatus]
MAYPKTIGSTLTVFLVSDAARSQAYYRDVLGFSVTDWWAERDGLNGLALKLLQAAKPEDVRPNAPAAGQSVGVDVYAYVDTWAKLEALFDEFKEKGAPIAQEIVTYPEGGPWKEFIVRDPDGYAIAFGGVDGRPGGRRSPIRPHIGSVTIAVSDLGRAAERYARLLDLNVPGPDRVLGRSHMLTFEAGSDLTLVSEVEDGGSGTEHPLFTVFTDDIGGARDFALSLGFEVESGTGYAGVAGTDAGGLLLRDEDGNRLLVAGLPAGR